MPNSLASMSNMTHKNTYRFCIWHFGWFQEKCEHEIMHCLLRNRKAVISSLTSCKYGSLDERHFPMLRWNLHCLITRCDKLFWQGFLPNKFILTIAWENIGCLHILLGVHQSKMHLTIRIQLWHTFKIFSKRRKNNLKSHRLLFLTLGCTVKSVTLNAFLFQ